MKIFLRLIAVLTMIQLSTGSTAYADFTVTGPTTVCPRGTYTYTASGSPFANQYRWGVSLDNPYSPYASSGTSSTSSFPVSFDSPNTGVAYIKVEAYNTNSPINPLNSFVLVVNRSLPIPVKPNNGTVVFCGPNENVTVSSSPYIPYNPEDPSNMSSCLFHCAYQWQSPGGWNFQSGANSPSNNVTYGSDENSLVSPGSVSNGNNGSVTISALYSQCSYSVNTSNSAVLWVGSPAVSNGQVNGSSASGGTVYVPSGYANLNVDIAGGGSTNWYIANGSGSLSPSGNCCSVSFSNFVRVVVDASNRCGGGSSWTFYLSTQQGYSGYRIAPNPAKDQVSLVMDMKEMAGELIEGVELYNEKSKLCGSVGSDKLKAGKYDRNSIDFDVKNLPRGIYFLHVKMKDNVEKHQILLE